MSNGYIAFWKQMEAGLYFPVYRRCFRGGNSIFSLWPLSRFDYCTDSFCWFDPGSSGRIRRAFSPLVSSFSSYYKPVTYKLLNTVLTIRWPHIKQNQGSLKQHVMSAYSYTDVAFFILAHQLFCNFESTVEPRLRLTQILRSHHY